MKDHSERIAALSPLQRRMLELRLKKKTPEQPEAAASPGPAASPPGEAWEASAPPAYEPRGGGVKFSLFFFNTDESQALEHKYRFLLEAAQFADAHGFEAVWTPERHFHQFGGLYPAPSVLGAALAAKTERLQVRAGSVVLPLHNPIRVAEEWSVLDNLSNGRVAVSFASGWVPDDFVLAAEPYEDRRQVMFRDIETVRRLWRGEAVPASVAGGRRVEVKIFPKPVQRELPIWIASSGSPSTWVKAGEIGANVLTALLGFSLEEIAENVKLYREALARHGHDPRSGQVTLMLHTFVWDDPRAVREKVKGPLSDYLLTHLRIYENESLLKSLGVGAGAGQFTDDDKQALAEFAFERYFNTSGLFGVPETCLPLVRRLSAIGVDEIGCLIDFGVDERSVLESLVHLNALRELCGVEAVGGDEPVAAGLQGVG